MSDAGTLAQVLKYIALDDLVVEDERAETDPGAMDSLIQSIDAMGVLQPIVVVKRPKRRHGAEEFVEMKYMLMGGLDR